MKKFLTVLLLGIYLLLAACSTGTQAPKTVLELINGDQVVSLTMDQLKALPAVEGWSGVRSSDGVITAPTRYKGVPLITLLNQNGGIGQGRSLEVSMKMDMLSPWIQAIYLMGITSPMMSPQAMKLRPMKCC